MTAPPTPSARHRTDPFERVVAEHGALVLRVCRGVFGAHPDADDAWSETFLAALRAWPTLDAETNIPAWLVTVAHRKAIDVLRSRRREPMPVETVPDRMSNLGIPGSGDPLRDLLHAVSELPPRQRAAVSLHHLGQLPFREVAEEMGGTVEAARRAAADGISALRRRFRDEINTGAATRTSPPAPPRNQTMRGERP